MKSPTLTRAAVIAVLLFSLFLIHSCKKDKMLTTAQTSDNTATVIMHEAVHAYLTAKGTAAQLQHEDIAISYVTEMAGALQQMFPGLSEADSKNLALGGLQTTTTFKYTIANDMQLSGSFDATQLAYSIGSSGTRCK